MKSKKIIILENKIKFLEEALEIIKQQKCKHYYCNSTWTKCHLCNYMNYNTQPELCKGNKK